jgi:hypothetical protein
MVISSVCTPYGASRGSKPTAAGGDVGAVGGENERGEKRERHGSEVEISRGEA